MTEPTTGNEPRTDEPEGTILRKVRMSETLFQLLGADRVAWGEPDEEGFYTPTAYRAKDGAAEIDVERLVDLIEQAFFETGTGLEAALLAAERIAAEYVRLQEQKR